jgi:hypothetical protein
MPFDVGTPVTVYMRRRLRGSRVLIGIMGDVDLYGFRLYPRRAPDDEVSYWIPFDAVRAIEVTDG